MDETEDKSPFPCATSYVTSFIHNRCFPPPIAGARLDRLSSFFRCGDVFELKGDLQKAAVEALEAAAGPLIG